MEGTIGISRHSAGVGPPGPRLLLAEDIVPRHCMARLCGIGSNDENITLRFGGPYSDNGVGLHLVNHLYRMK